MVDNVLINPHVSHLKESATLAINLKAKELREKGIDVSHFGFGESPFPVPSSLQEELKKNAHHKEYLPTKGLQLLRETIAEYYNKKNGYHLSPDHLMIGPGSKELIFQALYSLEGPVLVPAPSWVSYGPQVNLRGKRIVPIQTKIENSFRLTAEALEKSLVDLKDEPQKVLIFNNPGNPTGGFYRKEDIHALAKLCREHNVIIISDEIYSQVLFSNEPYHSFHHECPERTIVTGGLSKSHAAGGYRLGFMATPEGMEGLLKSICSFISETFSAVSAPIQYAAVAGYRNHEDVENFIQKTSLIHKACGEYLHERLTAMGVEAALPEGAFYIFPVFRKFREQFEKMKIFNDYQLAERLLSEFNVACLPGQDFYFDEHEFGLRLAFVDYDGGSVLKAANKHDHLDRQFVETHCPRLKVGMDRIQKFLNQ